MSIKENHLLGKFRERLILYGWCVTLLILIKTVLRKLFGFSWEKYYLMARDLNNLPELPEEKIYRKRTVYSRLREQTLGAIFLRCKQETIVPRTVCQSES